MPVAESQHEAARRRAPIEERPRLLGLGTRVGVGGLDLRRERRIERIAHARMDRDDIGVERGDIARCKHRPWIRRRRGAKAERQQDDGS
ncbi:hypothetical protein [uncultured Sphingomonas sp.]|uniref:hypothetical protein n=1 Tax=uncultured Sphingomonas sp. TaxID=158754 RepID=UPI0035C9D9DF